MEEAPKIKQTDKLLASTVLRFIPRFVTPNHLTVFRFCTVPVIFWFLFEEQYMWGVMIFTFSALTDAFDGALARTRNQCTEWGKLYDPLADKLLIITACSVLMIRFLDVYLFVALAFIELCIIGHAAFLKFARNKVVGAHISGKIKMILQSTGTAGLVLHAIAGEAVSLVIISGIFYVAMAFGVASLIVYRSA